MTDHNKYSECAQGLTLRERIGCLSYSQELALLIQEPANNGMTVRVEAPTPGELVAMLENAGLFDGKALLAERRGIFQADRGKIVIWA